MKQNRIVTLGFTCMLLAAAFCSGCNIEPQPQLPLSEKKFAIVVKSKGNQYFDSITNEFCSVIQSQGGTVMVLEPDTASAEEQITIINELIIEHVDSIAIAANSETAIEPALKRAIAQGISVLSFDSSVSAESRALHINQADAERIAEKLMTAVADMTGGTGQIAILSTTNQAHNQNIWIEKMRDILEAGTYPELMLVDIVYGEDDYEKSYAKTQQLIASYPELSAIIVPTAAGIPAVAQCVLDSGMESKIKITGLGLPSQMHNFIGADSVCPYLFLWDTEAVGQLTAYAAMALVNGTITGEPGEAISAGELGEYVITADPFGGNEVVLQSDPLCFDGDNIAHWSEVY